jgi:hypothetical protein
MEQYPPHETVEAVARFVREEAARLAGSGVNWKITLNGSAGGNVRAVVETSGRDQTHRTGESAELRAGWLTNVTRKGRTLD